MSLDLQIVCAFGLESVVAREAKALGYEQTSTVDGRVRLTADESAVARLNVFLRAADRVQVVVARFKATDFGQLRDGADAVDWKRWIARDGAFPVTGRSVRSKLTSVPDCQRLVKKSIVKGLVGDGRATESGAEYPVHVSLLKDEVTISLDTTGPGLHKRGYRNRPGQAALRETLAAALVQLSYWNRDRPLIDPFCGTGTILIEAAWIGMNRPPGLRRDFPAESWPTISPKLWSDAREEGYDGMVHDLPGPIQGFDNDRRQITLAREIADRAGVADLIHFQQRDVSELSSPHAFGCLIANPPYGERLMGDDLDQLDAMYRSFAERTQSLDRWSTYILSGYGGVEEAFGRRADRRRKLFNGPIEATYYQYPGPRPPRRDRATE